ncbi:tetraspanin-33-like [Tribolium madens]|uniref:tetraspanin-33-like n=1 Tax=Tribolium madens TaxID=41895 RepID=UPI001CF72CDC|nr:tetraspanin-33-like [Tribolium madens]
MSVVVRCISLILNVVLGLLSIVVAGYGIILINNENKTRPVSSASFGARFSALGIVTFLVSFFGCCGSIKDNIKFLSSCCLYACFVVFAWEHFR